MRRRRTARRVVAAAALGFLAFLVLSVKPRGTRTRDVPGEVAETLVREAPGLRDRLRFRDFVYDESRKQEGTFRLRAAEAIGFSENGEDSFRLKDVEVEARGADAATPVFLRAPRAELNQNSRAVRVFDGVTLQGQDLTLRAAAVRYDPASKAFSSEGPVAAVRGRLVGSAAAGKVETRDGRMSLEGDVRLRGRDEKGRPVSIEAPLLVLGRDGALLASGGVSLKTDQLVLRSESLSRATEDGGDRLRAAGDARVLVVPRERGLPAPAVVRGEAIDLVRSADGLPRLLTVASPGAEARIDVAPSERAGARRVVTARADVRFASGQLSEVTFPESFRGAETAAAPGPDGGLRELSARFARVTFRPDDGRLDVAALEGEVVATEGSRARLTAARGTLRGADDSAVFAGDPGAPASYRDERGAVTAKVLEYHRREERVEASGDVAASYAGAERANLPGGEAGEPFFSESDALQLLVRERRLRLTGNVKAWQKENVLRSSTLVVDDGERSLRAEGNVRASLKRRAAAAASGAPKKPDETLHASGDLLTHREAERTVRIEGRATLVSGSFRVTSDVTDVKISADRSAEYAEARGSVLLEDSAQRRRGEGSRATWRAQTDVVTLEGEPARAVDGSGNRLAGAVLTFRQGRSRVDVESAPGVKTEGVFRPEGS